MRFIIGSDPQPEGRDLRRLSGLAASAINEQARLPGILQDLEQIAGEYFDAPVRFVFDIPGPTA